MMERIPVAGPWITQKEIDYVSDAVTNAWYGNANVYHDRFEKAFAEHLGVKHAVALPSCTAAIHLSLLAIGVGPGDEVIVPDITWIATAAPITYVGATPVFADVDARTWCLSADSFEECITPRTKAVIPVDLYGGVPDWDAIRAIATNHGIAIVEDAAEAIGSEYHGKRAGGFGRTGVFSFHGSKTLTTGEGGMLVTDDDAIHERVLFLRDHGRQPDGPMFFNTEVAYKYKMSAMQAALGLAQLERVEELVARKRKIFSWYSTTLGKRSDIELNFEAPGTTNSYWMTTAVLAEGPAADKDRLVSEMKARGIDCRPFFRPLSLLMAYEGNRRTGRNPISASIAPRGINLPSALSLEQPHVERACAALINLVSDVTVALRR